jgi:hypothetical protein
LVTEVINRQFGQKGSMIIFPTLHKNHDMWSIGIASAKSFSNVSKRKREFSVVYFLTPFIMSEGKNRPRFTMSSKTKGDNGEVIWKDIGAIFASRDGKGYNVLVKENLADILANDVIYLRPPKPKKKSNDQSPAEKSAEPTVNEGPKS